MTPAEALRLALAGAYPAGPPQRLGVAVSGGGDSMALLHLLADWARVTALHVVTVNHGLRPEATAEAQAVGAAASALGLPHSTLDWTSWDGTGNLQDQARRARQSLIRDWACAADIPDIALGHTLDDQAETVLLRLARGSGVDGLSAMQAVRADGPLRWLRPLLTVSRAALRADLTARGVPWADDPSNDDPRFDRVKARRALSALAPLGVTVTGLADTAARMADARAVLEAAADSLARQAATRQAGDLCLAAQSLAAALPETRMRLFARALRHVTGADYAPRRAALSDALDTALAGGTTTLGGCIILGGATIRVAREYAAADRTTAPIGALWDNRWQITGPALPDGEIRAIGENGLLQLPEWRETGRPRAVLLADPGVWQGDFLVAAPTIVSNALYKAHFRPEGDEFIL